MSHRNTLAWRVLLVLGLAVATPTVVVGALAIRGARTNLEREVVRGNLALIRALGAGLDGRLQSARRTLDVAAAQWADDREHGDPERDQSTARLLRRLRRDVPLFSKLAILSPDGEVLPQSDAIGVEAGAGAHTFGGYIGDITFEEGKPRILVFSQARSRTGELIATFVAQIDLGFIEDTLAETRLGEGARLLVVDGEGVPVARSDGESVNRARSLRGVNPAVDRALGSATEGHVSAGGVVAVYRNLSTYQSLRGVRWAIILEQPERQAYALAHETTRNTILALVSALALALLVGTLLATRLTRPLHALAERADAIATGGAAKPAEPIRGPGEIGELAARVEEMARRLGEREQLKDALARGDRLATVGTMSASVAHEINNPLTTVLGYAKLLMEDKGDDHPDRTGLQLIADEAERMQGIVRGLLDYARSESAQLDVQADVNELVERTRALLAPQLRKRHVDLELSRASALPPAAIDPHRLQQVLVNLVQNAAQAMPDGGRVTVHTELGPAARTVHVRVVDQGPGVAPEARDRVFDPFYTTKGPGAGTGLGLAVVKHLVSRARGTITVEDGDGGRGACFRVVLPIVE